MADSRHERRASGVGPATLMAAGLGWVGGHFAWPGPELADQMLVATAHAVPVALTITAIHLLGRERWTSVGRLTLTVLAVGIKTMTVTAVLWAVLDPAAGFGPHSAWDWVPLGMANAGAVEALMTVDASYLEAGMEQLETDYGSVENYLTHGLGLTAAQVQALRTKLIG